MSTSGHASPIAIRRSHPRIWSVAVQSGFLADRADRRLFLLHQYHSAALVISGFAIPVIPLTWLVSPDPLYLVFVQILLGIFWSGFTSSTANYLYDIRPHRTTFALYAVIQSGSSAIMVFCGGLIGGVLARYAPTLANAITGFWEPGSALFIVFIGSAILREAIVAWFMPRLKEPTIRSRPQLLDVIFRIARINSISGVALDWMSVTRKDPTADRRTTETPKDPG